jgi:hypothetical protein
MYFRAMKIVSVISTGGYTLQVAFEDGIKGRVDLSGLVKTGVFTVLKDEQRFAAVSTNGYSVAWSDELEIDAATIYSELSGKDPANFFSKGTYATN